MKGERGIRVQQKRRLVLAAPAKINWALAIIGRRADGYHLLQSVFQSISLADQVMVTVDEWKAGPVIRCICRMAAEPEKVVAALSGADNLAYGAAERFREFLEIKGIPCPAIAIDIEKRIPIAAGLAGGSSDAAAVLRALNLLLGSPLTAQELLAVAAQCGSDTSFCLWGGTQWVQGTGTELVRWPSAPRWSLVVVRPEQGISTGAAYRAYDRLRCGSDLQSNHQETAAGEDGLDRAAWYTALRAADRPAVAALLSNSLEAASITLCPEIARIKEELLAAGCIGALMSGSGSAVFGLPAEDGLAERIRSHMQRKGFSRTWIVETIGACDIPC